MGRYGRKRYKIKTHRRALQTGKAIAHDATSSRAKYFHRASNRLISRGHARSRGQNHDPSDFAQIWCNGRVQGHTPSPEIFLPGIKPFDLQRSHWYSKYMEPYGQKFGKIATPQISFKFGAMVEYKATHHHTKLFSRASNGLTSRGQIDIQITWDYGLWAETVQN